MNESVSLKTTPKDFFLYIGMIVALYVSAVSLLTVAFQAINTLFPDALDYPYSMVSNASALRVGVSALVVAFPIFLLLSRAIYREFAAFPDRRDLWIRRWLVYLTLFIAGVALAVNIIVLVNTFLEGEITRRFVLKVLAVSVVAGAIFRYYIFDFRRDVVATAPLVRRLGWIASALVVGSIVGGVLIVGTPTSQRLVRLDERRVSDLSNVQYQLLDYWQRKGALPESFEALEDPLAGFQVPMDPVSGAPYEYHKTGDHAFELCATFDTSSQPEDNKGISSPYPVEFGGENNWRHETGRACFDRTIDPERYPPLNTTPPDGGPIPVKSLPVPVQIR